MKDITGLKFNKLTAIKKLYSKKYGKSNRVVNYYLCSCECGNTTKVGDIPLLRGTIKSCGCLKIEKVSTHKLAKHPLYQRWIYMRYRCNNPNYKYYKNVGGKGIGYFPAWDDFVNFHNWAMELGWKKGAMLARYDQEKDFTPENCYFTYKQQETHCKKRQVFIEYKGMRLPLKKACTLYGKDYNLVRHRLYAGWEVERAFETPKSINSLPKDKRMNELLKKSK
jgi:hypothetical protein